MVFVKKLLFIFLGSLCLLSASFGALTDNNEAYWTLDNTLTDATGNGHTLTNNGATYTSSGKIDGSYSFNGVNTQMSDLITIPNTDFTISIWLKATSQTGGTHNYASVYGFDAPGYTSSPYPGITFFNGNLGSGDQIVARVDGNNKIDYFTTAGTDNVWHHWVFIRQGTTLYLYLDGVQVASQVVAAIDITSTIMRFGSNLGSATAQNLQGIIDEPSIWNRAISSTEVIELYNSGIGLQYPYSTSSSTPPITTDIQPYYSTENISIQLNSTINVNMSYILDNGIKTNICNNCNSTILNLNSLIEGSHSILFESVDSNGQVNSSANFTIDLTSPGINIFNTSEINSYSIDWTQHFNYSDTNLDSCQVTVENSTQNCSSYNFAENGNQSIEIYVNDSAGNSATDSYIQLINPNQYFRIYDNARALNIENYSFGNYNSSGQYVTIPLYDLGLGTHSLQFSKFGYSQENFQFIFNSTSALNQTFNGTAVTITVKVYDESSPSTQLNFNLSMNNVLNYTQYLNQLNFQKYYNETLTGNLTLTAESSGFSLRKVFTELNPYSAVSHKIYLLSDADSTPVVFRTLNLAQTQAIEDVVFTFNKEISGVPTFLGQAKTDSQGYTYFNMDVLTDYEITISKSGYVSQVINSIPGKTDYTILMEEEGSTGSFLFDDFSYIINPQSTPESLPFNASVVVFDEANLISSMKFSVIGENTSETQILTAASGGTIQFEITNSSPQYVLNLTVMREGTEYNFIKKIYYYVEPATNTTVKKVAAELEGEENNENRVFMILIIYVAAIVLGSLFSPSMGAIFGLLPITIFAFVNWITVGIAALFYVFTILGVLYFER